MTPTLKAIVEDGYRIFGGYRLDSRLAVCHCPACMTPETERELITTPLRALQSPLLGEYTNSAHGWDDDAVAAEMRYFLPRYLELIALDDPPDYLGLPPCLRRLGDADWRSKWPDAETDLLDRFFAAFIVSCLARTDLVETPAGWRLKFDFADVLSLVANAKGDIDQALAAWDGGPDPGAAIHMAALRAQVVRTPERAYLYSAFLEGAHRDAADKIGAFLTRPEIDKRLEGAFFHVDDVGLQQILSDALS